MAWALFTLLKYSSLRNTPFHGRKRIWASNLHCGSPNQGRVTGVKKTRDPDTCESMDVA